jgi:UDP-N-acetylmuramyl pentapeptide synthase
MDLEMILLTGKEFSHCHSSSKILKFKDNTHLINYIQKTQPERFLFLVKGSRGMKLEEVVGWL